MAYPDWPTSAGHLLNPPGWWQGEATRWEHGHRLVGWVVGVLAIALATLCWRDRGLVRALGLGTLVAIVIQGLLGGLRVTEVSTALAMVHGIWGQACFCLVAMTALATSRAWLECGPAAETGAAVSLQRLCLLAAVSTFVQLFLGAALRHFGSGLALVAHILWACVVVFLVGWITIWVAGAGSGVRLLTRLASTLGILVVLQLLLGGFVWLVSFGGIAFPSGLGWAVPTVHSAVGALLLACSVLLTASVYRMLQPAVRIDTLTGVLPSWPAASGAPAGSSTGKGRLTLPPPRRADAT